MSIIVGVMVPVVLSLMVLAVESERHVRLKGADQDFVGRVEQWHIMTLSSSRLAIARQMGSMELDLAQTLIADHRAFTLRLEALCVSKGFSITSVLDAVNRQALEQLGNVAERDFSRAYISLQLQGHQTALDLFSDHGCHALDDDIRHFAWEVLPRIHTHLANLALIADRE